MLINEEWFICQRYIGKCNLFAKFTSPKSRIALQIAGKIALCDSAKFTCINHLVNLKK